MASGKSHPMAEQVDNAKVNQELYGQRSGLGFSRVREAIKGFEAEVSHDPIYLFVRLFYHEENRLEGRKNRGTAWDTVVIV